MSLPPLAGHEELRGRLRAAVRAGRFPQSLLLHGPPGVGKQRLALWTAALLECTAEGERPCGSCRDCRLAGRLEHPDVHWHFPLPRPKGASDDRLRAKLEEARLEALAARRAEPLRLPSEEEATGIYLAAVEEMRRAAARRPAMGRHAVFVIGEADRMVPQAASPEAANAFLKLLEEPPPDTFLLLTSSRPDALLPTIRSRTLAVRVAPLPETEVAAFLREAAGLEPEQAERLAALSGGSIGRALRLAEEAEGAEGGGRALLAAALSGRRADRLRLALGLGASGARGAFRTGLVELSGHLRDLLRAASGAGDLPPGLREAVGGRRLSPESVLAAFERVQTALAEADGNVNPQATAAVLLTDLAEALGGNPRGGAG